MKVVDVHKLPKERIVKFTGGDSFRAIVKNDGLGFSVNKTVVKQGGAYRWHYKNHLEACYCISGEGMLTNRETSESFRIAEGKVYLLDKHDDHEFTAFTDVVLISIFNPPLTGKETHDKDGNYEVL